MTEQERKGAKRTTRTDEETPTVPNAVVAEKGQKIKKSIDGVLDEIDAVLEENAEEFVKSYVQRGGE
jgi:ubiquitin-like protein Pup